MAQSSRIKTSTRPRQAGIPSLGIAIAISAVLHLFVWLAVVTATDGAPRARIGTPVMTVSLVSLPGPPPSAAGKPAKAAVQPKTVQTPPAEPKPVDAVPVETKKKLKQKTSLKKKTLKTDSLVKKAIDKVEKNVAESRPPALQETFKRLQQRVEEAEQSDPSGPTPSAPDQTGQPMSGGVYGRSNFGDPAVRDRIRIYQAEIAYHVQRNWVFSEQLARSDSDLIAELGITILPNGDIKDVWFDRKSGNAHLDDSAYKAIMKSNPLPPLPSGLFKSSYTVGLRFGPKGIKK